MPYKRSYAKRSTKRSSYRRKSYAKPARPVYRKKYRSSLKKGRSMQIQSAVQLIKAIRGNASTILDRAANGRVN